MPTGLGTITMTNPNYQVYHGVILTVNKRFSNRWQMNGSLTLQDNPQYTPYGPGVAESNVTNPTGVEFTNGVSTLAPLPVQAERQLRAAVGHQRRPAT